MLVFCKIERYIMVLTVISPAKVNLTLDVYAKKPGASFHEIESVMHKLAFGDIMTLSEAHSFMIQGNFGCEMSDNLIYKAWHLLPEALRFPVRVSVDKRIPLEAGLGGGSSNVASFLRLYTQFFDLDYENLCDELGSSLSDLGKDIRFFLGGAVCALGTGFGETIDSLETSFSGRKIYLYVPDFGNNTASSYAMLKTFGTNHTRNFLQHSDLEFCGNTFDQLFYTKKYEDLFCNVNHPTHLFYITGSGSAFYAFEKYEIPGTKLIETTLA